MSELPIIKKKFLSKEIERKTPETYAASHDTPQLLPVQTNLMWEFLKCVALPRHIKDVSYDHRLFFTSFVNYITGENITQRKSVKSNVSISCDLQCNC